MQRLAVIEGFRAYLAMWVVFDHLLGSSGYGITAFRGFFRLLRQGEYAVDLFVIISGFVIFFLLEKKREPYLVFVTRRFFRLYPLFIVLFVISIPKTALFSANLAAGLDAGILSQEHVAGLTGRIESAWAHVWAHTALHSTMLHGIVPDSILPDAPSAFLGPAWSISLEWQFYLLAPLAFALATSRSSLNRGLLCAICVFLFIAARSFLPTVSRGAALPFHIEFFFIGGASFFAWKTLESQKIAEGSALPTALTLAIFLYFLAGRSRAFIPVAIWLIVLGLMLERPSFIAARILSPFFSHRLVQFLGRISYSIYLSHALVITVVQTVLLRLLPDLSRPLHFLGLSLITLPVTLALSALLYKFVEEPGIIAGKRLIERFSKSQITGSILPAT